VSVSTKRRPAPRPVEAPQAPASPLPVTEPVAAEGAAAPHTSVYRGDTYGLMIWFGGAIILAILHIVDVVYWWFHR